MKKGGRILGLVVGMLPFDMPVVAHAQGLVPPPVPLVFDGVTVIDVERGERLPAHRVVVMGNRIQMVGSTNAVPVPKGAQVVEAHGKYVIPGLWDMYTQSREYAHAFYPLFLANGVTGIRDLRPNMPLDSLLRWRQEILAGGRVGPPRQILSGHPIDGETPDSARARHLVDSLKATGADMVTMGMPHMSREMYFVVAAEARRAGIPVGGRADRMWPIAAADSGVGLFDYLFFSKALKGCWGNDVSVNVPECQPLAETLRRNGAWLTLTLILLGKADLIKTSPRFKDILARFDEQVRTFWTDSVAHSNTPASRDSAGAKTANGTSPSSSTVGAFGYMDVMQDVDLPILAATDAGAQVLRIVPPGVSLHTELETYVAEGLTPLNALRTATLNPARYLRGTDSLGTVAPGKLADFVLLDADPLADITNTTKIRAVVANGRYFDRDALDRLLAEGKAAANKIDQRVP